ncbi:hypothetical protein ACQRBN_04590 [Bariatricus sp. SGI.154]|uniref:hypothetical protein n=1 Tax=Bariatricus sp. SGI.154 TaxID=3420549 RepID=UPI003D0234CC
MRRQWREPWMNASGEGILEEFLRKNRSEVISVSIFEYDEERHLQQEREEAWAKGREEGRDIEKRRVNILNGYLIADNRMEDLRRSIKDVDFQKELMEEYGIE